MLSIKNIVSSAVAASYFQKDDYYVGKDTGPEAEGVWWGKGAATLGLEGAVDKDAFKDLLDGKLPDGEQLGTIREKGGEKEHIPGWDLTFSAPKSVSILALVGGDERLIAAHDEAVRLTLEWAEANIAGHRKRDKDGVYQQDADNLTAAMFRHSTSRDMDAQLHTHVVVLNMNQDDDGQWRSLNSKPLYDHKMALGNVYRAYLAGLTQEAGHEIEKTGIDGRFEIVSVPKEVAADQSQRSTAIRDAMAERGLEGPIAAEKAALMTRPSKGTASMNELVPEWQERALARGFDTGKVVEEARERGPVQPVRAASFDRNVTEAVDRLADKEAVFSNAHLLQWSLAGAIGRGTVKDVEAAIGRATGERDIEATSLGFQKAWTTPKARHVENTVIDMWHSSRGAVDAPLSTKNAGKRLDAADAAAVAANPEKAHPLNDGQRAAAVAILTQTDRFIGIEGRAGVGKTTMLGRVRPVLEARGFEVIGMAGNANAARTIEQDAGIKSTTLQKHILTAEKALVEADKNPFSRGQILDKTSRQVWVVDESSQLGGKQVKRLMHLADRLGSRVVMIGDTKQLAAIEAGKPFAQLFNAGMQRTVIETNLRQRNQDHKDAVAQASAGNVRGAMATLSKETVQIESREQRLKAIVTRWGRMGDARATTTVLTARNAERIQLNEQMRDILRSEGKLKGEVPLVALTKAYAERMDKVDTLTYRKGDLVQFGRGVKAADIKGGEYLRVDAIDQKNNRLTLTRTVAGKETETVTWNPREVAASARNGVTIYRERQTSLAPGEKLQWGQNAPDYKLSDGSPLVNGRVLTVASLDRDNVRLVAESGAHVTIKPGDFKGQHWDHAYATTVYKSQGRTEEHVLVNAEANQTELFNQKAFVVAISRQRDSIKLYTDNTEAFTGNVDKKLGEKTTVEGSALDHQLALERAKHKDEIDNYRGPTKTRQDDPAEAARRAAEEAKKTAERTKDADRPRDNDRSRRNDFGAGI